MTYILTRLAHTNIVYKNPLLLSIRNIILGSDSFGQSCTPARASLVWRSHRFRHTTLVPRISPTWDSTPQYSPSESIACKGGLFGGHSSLSSQSGLLFLSEGALLLIVSTNFYLLPSLVSPWHFSVEDSDNWYWPCLWYRDLISSTPSYSITQFA